MALPSPALTQNNWTCPTCQHGSPDPRDEMAHLDAHRQLGQFFREWDEAVVSDRRKERGRRTLVVVLGALAVVVALVAGLAFWSLGRTGGSAPPAAGPAPGAVAPDPAPTPAPTVPAPAVPAPVAQPAPPLLPVAAPADAQPTDSAAPTVLSDSAEVAPTATTISAGTSTSQAPTVSATPAVAPPAYLAKVCVLGSCLTIP